MTTEKTTTICRSLISVSDKSGLDQFANRLRHQKIEILSTGGTQKYLESCDIKTTSIADITGSPEIMDGRVKTLHPRVHGGILARRGMDDATMETHGIKSIDLVVVNLYPFSQTIAKPDCTVSDAIENIDIGGPAMVRAAAKNHEYVTIIVDPKDYMKVADEIDSTGGVSRKTRQLLAAKAFAHTATYDSAITKYLNTQLNISETDNRKSDFTETLTLEFTKQADLRYGENPHQQAAFYVESTPPPATLATTKQLQGKMLSYNNIVDTDAALACVKSFSESACVIVKHANPCGVATGATTLEAYKRAFSADKTSAFGGIIAFNRPLDEETAKTIISNQFVEVIIAPKIEERAAFMLREKPNVRVLDCGSLPRRVAPEIFYKRISGGLLAQSADQITMTPSEMKVVTKQQPTAQEMADLQFVWQVVKFVKSNAIIYAKNNQTTGIGAGQMSRVISAKIAAMKAEEEGFSLRGAVMASDAFFPFRDGIDIAAEMGIRAVIQPGGSIKDQEIIDAANEHGMTMIFTGVRHFLH